MSCMHGRSFHFDNEQDIHMSSFRKLWEKWQLRPASFGVGAYLYCTSPMFHIQIVISITCWCLVDTSRIFVYPSYYVMGRYHESSYVILLISKPFSLGLMKAKNCMIFMYLNDIENKKYHQVRTHIKNGEVLIIDTPMVLKRNYGTNPTLV